MTDDEFKEAWSLDARDAVYFTDLTDGTLQSVRRYYRAISRRPSGVWCWCSKHKEEA